MAFNKSEKRLLDQIAGSKVGSDLLETKIDEGGSGGSLDSESGLVLDETTTWAFNEGIAPVRDPKGRQGWYYTSPNATPGGDYFSWRGIDNDSPTLAADIFELQDLTSAYAIFSVDNMVASNSAEIPTIQYYTIPKGDAGDAAAWYRSRITWVWPVAATPPVPGQKYLVYTGTDPGVHLNLPRQVLEPGVSTTGPQDADEQVWRFSIDVSTTNVNSEILVDTLGVQGTAVTREWMFDWSDNQILTIRDLKRALRNAE